MGCLAGRPPADDGIACTVDTCSESTDRVTNTADNTRCDDGLYCNGPERCDRLLDCRPGTPPRMDDGITCTVESCDEATDSILHTPSSASCDDGRFCNGAETCDVTRGCVAGPSPTNDGVSCTVDSCDEATDTVSHVPTDSRCNDSNMCNGVETCHPTLGCQAHRPRPRSSGA